MHMRALPDIVTTSTSAPVANGRNLGLKAIFIDV